MKEKFYLLTISAFNLVFYSNAQTTGSFTDSRDGKIYKTVIIGNQTWMAQNLDFKSVNSYCYNDSLPNCAKYGRLYELETAKQSCPSGWHVPSITEWKTLSDFLGGDKGAAVKLKEKILTNYCHCKSLPITSNETGFSAIMGGTRFNDGTYHDIDFLGNWWSSTQSSNKDFSWTRGMNFCSKYTFWDICYEKDAFSVRCIKN